MLSTAGGSRIAGGRWESVAFLARYLLARRSSLLASFPSILTFLPLARALPSAYSLRRGAQRRLRCSGEKKLPAKGTSSPQAGMTGSEDSHCSSGGGFLSSSSFLCVVVAVISTPLVKPSTNNHHNGASKRFRCVQRWNSGRYKDGLWH